uniref:Proline rich 5 like n=1 Tax=Seriola dumerili TaxID=41447 RepID=A0A3B4VIR4_SERDU
NRTRLGPIFNDIEYHNISLHTCMMGSFRRPRPRFMSSPVLSDLARFHASSPSLQISNTSVWNSVQSAVVKVFQGGALQTNELFTLNESIRWLLKTEMGSFITDYFQLMCFHGNHLPPVPVGDDQLAVLADMWDRFFTETLPTLQAIFYPVQGQELTVRQMALLAFRDLVLLKLHLEETLGAAASVPPPVTQMLLVLQSRHLRSSGSGLLLGDQPEITITQHHSSSDSSSLAPLVEQEGEAYLEKVGGVRRHTVANAHSDVRLLSASGRMHAGTENDNGVLVGGGSITPRPFSSQPDMVESPRGGVICLPDS